MRDRVVWTVAAAYAAAFTALGVLKYLAHRNLVDFGIFEQTAADGFGGFHNAVEGTHWAFHFSPVLLLITALLKVWRSPYVLIALQSAACALVIPPICDIVLRRHGARAARLTAAVLFVYPALAGLAFNDFHENAFAPAAIAWTIWAFDAGRMRLAVLFAFSALLIKEDQALFLAIAAALTMWRYRGTMWALAAALVLMASVTVAANYFLNLQPHAAAALTHWQPVRFYAWNSTGLSTLFPSGIVARAGFLLLAFGPLLFLPFRSRVMWTAAAPLAEVLLSRMPTTYTLGSHYAGAWLGYALGAFAFALKAAPRNRVHALSLWCFGLCALVMLVADPLHPGINLRFPQPRDAALDATVARVPAGASVATQEEAFGHLALDDPNATVLPESGVVPIDACYVLVDSDWPQSPRLVEYGATLTRDIRDGIYRLAYRQAGARLYRNVRCR